MKILVTGSSGLVGSALASALSRSGHTVCRLLRPDSVAGPRTESLGIPLRWNPATGELEGAAAGAEAVVNLAGESIAAGRWNAERKARLRSSRVAGTRNLVTAVGRLDPRPKVFVSASAIGYYGDRGEEELTEESAAGNDFLAGLAKEWEAEAARAEDFGMRSVQLRFGVILARHGGALARMLLPFRLGLGGRLGSGRQWMSWLTLAETVSIVRCALENPEARGPINAVSSQPVRNSEFTAALARTLSRPAIVPAPAFALRVALGEMADALLLSSQRVLPQRLTELGYRFLHPDLPSALFAALFGQVG
jgi:hypothetical protein